MLSDTKTMTGSYTLRSAKSRNDDEWPKGTTETDKENWWKALWSDMISVYQDDGDGVRPGLVEGKLYVVSIKDNNGNEMERLYRISGRKFTKKGILWHNDHRIRGQFGDGDYFKKEKKVDVEFREPSPKDFAIFARNSADFQVQLTGLVIDIVDDLSKKAEESLKKAEENVEEAKRARKEAEKERRKGWVTAPAAFILGATIDLGLISELFNLSKGLEKILVTVVPVCALFIILLVQFKKNK